MKDQDFSEFMRKTDELRTLFVLSQRVIPFLEEIIMFVSEIRPLLTEINQSISENIKRMPNMSKQLSKVTEATEIATNEIMNVIDGIDVKTDLLSENINKMEQVFAESQESLLKNFAEQAAMAELKLVHLKELNEIREVFDKNFKEISGDNKKIINSIKDDSTSIMISLQVQDITAQQISAVNHLLETVQEKLLGILRKFQFSDLKELMNEKDDGHDRVNITKLHREIAFDPETVDSLSHGLNRQHDVDVLVNEHNFIPPQIVEESHAKSEEKDMTIVTQNDIDALFGV